MSDMAMQKVSSVDEFIEIHEGYKKELTYLRKLLLDTELDEQVKWMIPCYTLNNKNLIGIGAFKKYVGIWFYQGVFLKDPLNALINAQEGKTKAMRQWRFQSIDEIKKHSSSLKKYIAEAIQNQKDGLEVKPDRKKKKLEVPTLLAEAIKKDKKLDKAFTTLTDYKKKEYCEYIAEAKREATKLRRLEKILPMIMDGVGLNDRYK
jgi:uncharacterized protein YdeI (YjbR/CyaY-like superfamily)